MSSITIWVLFVAIILVYHSSILFLLTNASHILSRFVFNNSIVLRCCLYRKYLVMLWTEGCSSTCTTELYLSDKVHCIGDLHWACRKTRAFSSFRCFLYFYACLRRSGSIYCFAHVLLSVCRPDLFRSIKWVPFDQQPSNLIEWLLLLSRRGVGVSRWNCHLESENHVPQYLEYYLATSIQTS